MNLSNKELSAIREYLLKIERSDIVRARKYYVSNQVRNIRLILNRAERREKDTLL